MKANALVLVAAGSALGGSTRYSLDCLFGSGAGLAFPASTLLVNLFGSLLIGLLAGRWASADGVLGASGRWHFWITGVCGGFTTFSAFSREVLSMTLEGRGPLAGLYAATSLGLGILAVWAGLSYSLAGRASSAAATDSEDG